MSQASFRNASFRITARTMMVAFSLVISALGGHGAAHGELRWPNAKKEPIKVRLVALAWNHQRSSFFPSEEIFVAEKQLAPHESRLVKLIYGFLPYQPRLSESGFDYSTVYEMHAARDPSCDESLAQITTGRQGDWRQSKSSLEYSADAPTLNLRRGKSTLPCYRTTPEDYDRAVKEPVRQPRPVLTLR